MTTRLTNWVIPDESKKPGNNYVNPKAHKPDKNYPGRLISTGCESPANNLSALTDYELLKVPPPHVTNDTNHFLLKIKDLNERGVLIGKTVWHVSFDIVNMFPSISKEVGLEQCKDQLDKRIDPIFSTQCIQDAIEITLDHNLTEFNDVMYRQWYGTAQGSKNSCRYADNAMNKIDKLVIERGWDPMYLPLLWARFRDDIYTPWTHGLDKLHEFHRWLNTLLPGIEFTMTTPSLEGVVFLDTYVYMKDNILHTKCYSKPCDEHAFLVTSSCHPTHNIENIPYSIAHRIYRITSEPCEYEKTKHKFIEHLKARGYSIGAIEGAFKKVEQLDRNTLISGATKNNDRERAFPLITDFNPALPNVSKILNKHKYILDIDPELSQIINPDNIFASFRRPKTIQNLLIHSKLKSTNLTNNQQVDNIFEGGCKPCDKSCVLCRHFLKTTETFTSFHSNTIYNIKSNINCDTKNVIYLINDKVCNISYVGCTSDSAKVRFGNHKSHIKHRHSTCEVSTHFINNQHIHSLDRSSDINYNQSLSEHLEIIIIEHVDVGGVRESYDRLRICKVREGYWQNQLRTMESYGGMNVRHETRGLSNR